MIARAWPGNADAIAARSAPTNGEPRSEEHTSELQSPCNVVCRLLLEKKTVHPPRHAFRETPRVGDHFAKRTNPATRQSTSPTQQLISVEDPQIFPFVVPPRSSGAIDP